MTLPLIVIYILQTTSKNIENFDKIIKHENNYLKYIIIIYSTHN